MDGHTWVWAEYGRWPTVIIHPAWNVSAQHIEYPAQHRQQNTRPQQLSVYTCAPSHTHSSTTAKAYLCTTPGAQHCNCRCLSLMSVIDRLHTQALKMPLQSHSTNISQGTKVLSKYRKEEHELCNNNYIQSYVVIIL